MNGGITTEFFMSPSSATFTCQFESRLQVVRYGIGCRWGFDLKLTLKSIDIDGKVGRSRLSIFGGKVASSVGSLSLDDD